MVVTASDTRFMPFLTSMLHSIELRLREPSVSCACFDIGLSEGDRRTLRSRGVAVVPPQAHFGVDAKDLRPALLSFLARPFLRDYFPGYDIYLWIDSDVWFQDIDVFDTYISGAQMHGMAIAHEQTDAYRFQPWLLAWTGKHFLRGYGPVRTAWLLLQRHVNAGLFAIHALAPHWEAWAACYKAAIDKTGDLVPHDQFALNQALHSRRSNGHRLSTLLLPPGCNWICDRGIPIWDDALKAFCEPRAPFRRIGVLHLAGPAKAKQYEIKRTGGGHFVTALVRGASPDAPARPPVCESCAFVQA